MKEEKSNFNESAKARTGVNTFVFRVLIAGACLISVAVGISFLAGSHSRAATSPQESRASADGLWLDVAASSIPTGSSNQSRRDVLPTSYRTVRLNMDTLRQRLANVPLEFTKEAKSNPLELTMPMPDGKFGRFRIVESPMLEPRLAAQSPEIKTYSGQGIDDPTASMRCDLTLRGFHAFILSDEGAVVVAPYASDNTEDYLSYYLRDDPQEQNAFHCLVTEVEQVQTKVPGTPPVMPQLTEGVTRRTYRLAVAATAEYTALQGSVSLAKTGIVTLINSVNTIFNKELSIQLVLIDDENAIIFTDAQTDGYTSGTLTSLIAENQSKLDTVIGSAKYDIGHVVDGQPIGGLATLNTSCNTGKGQGASGVTNNSTVVVIAHELAHQLGASHTFNSVSGSCGLLGGSSQRAAESAYEPGSGSTLMSYARACLESDLEASPDLYFHNGNLEQIYKHIKGMDGSTVCGVNTSTNNFASAISQFSPDITIPAGTPFRLNAHFTDLDGNTNSVTWEELDLGDASPPEVDNGNRPLFRSIPPTNTDEGRTFPKLTYILNNNNQPPATRDCTPANSPQKTCLVGEQLPSTTRTMTFVGTARDNVSAVSSVTVHVHVVAGGGLFAVTTPNAATAAWTSGTRQTVVWARGGTASDPINCSNVKISISPNDGELFTDVLAESTPNDGSESVLIPEGILFDTDTARIKVESVIAGNFNSFFDISDAFSIKPLGVTNTNDIGPGSLRQAIDDANSDPALTKITFNIPGGGGHTINLLSGLPLVTTPVDIDATTQPGYAGTPLIQIDGGNPNVTQGTVGLILNAGNSKIRGLSLTRFSGGGIKLQTHGGNSIRNCYLGTNAAFSTGLGNSIAGVVIENTPNNAIGEQMPGSSNVISGNTVGILISGAAATGNEVRDNYIGTNADGTQLANTSDGVRISGAPNNLIGGTRLQNGISLPTGNIISGNGSDGIEITGSAATGNRIQANLIGLKPGGDEALGNFNSGIRIEGAPNNIIGGTDGSARNTISGNNNSGGIVLNAGSSGTIIQGNYVGTNYAGNAAVKNNFTDIYIESANNLVGGLVAGARNVITASGSGVYLAFAGATGNVVQGNYIGTDATGLVALNSTGEGISVIGAGNNTIGGTTAAARNIISGNGAGIHVAGGATNLLIQGNYIGTNPAGTAVVGNKFQGVYIEGSSITIGGSVAGAGNLISGNSTAGGYNAITLSTASGNTVQGNFIGTNAAGTAALGNGGYGIVLAGPGGPPNNNLIGGTNALARNIISANNNDGILITAYGSGNVVQGNYIGTDVTGTLNLGNGYSGVEIAGADNNTIGGIAVGAGNLIAFNGVVSPTLGDGVRLSSATVDNVFHGAGNRVRGNSIFSNVRLGIDLVGGTEGSGATAGVTANDPCDTDAGISAPNLLQNTPVLTSAGTDGATTTIVGTLNSTASSSYNLDFYASQDCDPSGSGEGRIYLGSATVNTNASCNGDFNAVLPVALAGDQMVTATATDATGNTSEFSHCMAATSSGGGVLAFNINQFDVLEGYNAATITVNRTGSSTGAVTVDYAVHDSSASQKSDYSTASGTLSFAAGETSKSFTVLINDDSFVEGPEFIDLSLSNPTGGATLGANANGVSRLRIMDDDVVNPPTANVIDEAQNFVYQHFHDFLAREPDAGGLAFWTGQVTQCGSDQSCLRAKRIDVSNAFFYELEYQQTGSYVFRLYREAFGNNQPSPNPDSSNPAEAKKLPSYDVFSRDRARVVGGTDLASGQLSAANAFGQRSEFLAKYPLTQDGPTFVDAVLATIKNDLGADLTSQRSALITLFSSGGRGAVLYRLADDNAQTNPINNRALIDAEYNRAFVATQYFGYLRRDSDIGGFLFWLGQVNAAPLRDVNRQHAMVCSFITATEYQQRFSSVVTHGNSECQ